MGILEVIESTLRALDLVEVRGKQSRNALSVAVDNLEALVKAYKDAIKKKEEEPNDNHDGQEQDV